MNIPPYNPAEKDKLLLRKKANEYRTLALIGDLIASNTFSPQETLALIKYVLDRYPHPLGNLPLPHLRILHSGVSEPENR